MLSTERFSGKAQLYQAYRPTYPAELVDWLYERAACERVCDIAAGTGLFTRCLLRKDWHVTAVEPNGDMAGAFRQALPEVELIQATGEATGLPAGSFGLVTIAQAFHWVDEVRFRAECVRILAPEGRLCIVWNNRIPEGISLARDAVDQRFCPSYRKGHAGTRTIEEGDRFLHEEYFRTLEVFSVEHTKEFTEEAFVGETLSRSYALGPTDPAYPAFVEALHAAFAEHARNGIAYETYEAIAYLGEV